MPLFTKGVKAHGIKSDCHDCLTDELVIPYLRENSQDALHGYLEAVVDLTCMIGKIASEATSLDELRAALDQFAVSQTDFVNRTDRRHDEICGL